MASTGEATLRDVWAYRPLSIDGYDEASAAVVAATDAAIAACAERVSIAGVPSSINHKPHQRAARTWLRSLRHQAMWRQLRTGVVPASYEIRQTINHILDQWEKPC